MQLKKTRIKLVKREETGELIGFVSRSAKSGRLFGVREEFIYGKKVCVVSDHLQGLLKENTLYEVSLKPMRSGAGYVIVTAKEILFEATVEVTLIPRSEYKVAVVFGNKKIYFDPLSGRTPSSNTIDGVLCVLESKDEILNRAEVIKEFSQEANRLFERMVRDGMCK